MTAISAYYNNWRNEVTRSVAHPLTEQVKALEGVRDEHLKFALNSAVAAQCKSAPLEETC